ncbi:MAG: Clp protease ClpP, partial [Rudaea sp.]|nr:Clp protease ClpP [Rudaea sp.]
MKNRKWWDIRALTNAQGASVAEIRIYDEIGFWGTDAKTFISQFDEVAANADEIVVAINSPGGDVFDAFAIYNALRRYAGRVTTRVDGVAASAASLVTMAGDRVVMPENAMLMIHNPWTVAAGTSADLRATADSMDKARDGILAAY